MDKNLLVVEDDSGLRRYFAILLRQMGYKVFTSSNGAEALGHLLKRKDFHLVLTDIDMPVMSGIEMIEEMRKREINVPVCAVSGINDDTVKLRLKELGCRDYLGKPVSAIDLAEKIKDILSRNTHSASFEA